MSAPRFTPEQLAVIRFRGGNALVSAVAGSGKTTTLVQRTVSMIRGGVDPQRMLITQFNVAAKLAFDSKLRAALPDDQAPPVRTFHALGYRMYQELVGMGEAPRAKLVTSDGALQGAARAVLKETFKAARPGAPMMPGDMDAFIQFITLVKAGLKSPEVVFAEGRFNNEYSCFPEAFRAFERVRQGSRILYFDDLIYDTALILDQADLWLHFARRLDEIQVDEAQDVNEIQFHTIRQLASAGANVLMCGDTDQTIYSYRGSNVKFLATEFDQVFAPVTRLPLTMTFRYGPEVALAASQMISRNIERDDKIAVAATGNVDTTVTLLPRAGKAESGLVSYLKPYQEQGNLRDCAVLVRHYAHTIPVEMELIKHAIPYFVYGRSSMIFQPEIASLVCAMSLATNCWAIDERVRHRFFSAFLRSPSLYLFNAVTDELVEVLTQAHLQGAYAALPKLLEGAVKNLRDRDQIDPRTLGGIRDRVAFLDLLVSGSLARDRPGAVISACLDHTRLLDWLPRQSATREQAEEKARNIQAFLQAAEGFDTIEDFLDTLGPLAAVEDEKPPAHDHLEVTSAHRSKGREWELVALPGWTEGVFPSGMSDDAEEERRLAYVAMTRAVRELYIMHTADPALDNWNADLTSAPVSGVPRAANTYLYDMELGLTRRIAQALRSGQPLKVDAREVEVARRYATAAGRNDIDVALPPALAALGNRRVMRPSEKLKPGQKVWSARRGICSVERQVGTGAVYQLMTDPGGESYYEAFNNPVGWYVLP